jgi:hypothetical protein
VPLLLKRNVEVLFGVLRGPHSDVPFFSACYGSAIILPEVAMGSPLSSTIAEIFLQDLEQNRLKNLLEDKKIVYYSRYIDDISIIHDQTKITPKTVLQQINAQHRDLQFTINEETDNQIAYFDLNLVNKQGHIEIEVYRNLQRWTLR